MIETYVGEWVQRDAALAALQAAPAPGSIDTAEFQRLAHDYRRHQTDADYTALVAHIDAHIAQRAASGDADYYAHIARVAQDAAALLKKMTPAPIADEVAGDTVAWLVTLPGGELELGAAYFDKDEADDYVENHAKEGCYLTELVVRPAAPKASAPDAAAGDLPPLPKPDVIGYTCIGENDAYSEMVLRKYGDDRARAAAAPAGHAVPVAKQKNPHFSTFPERIYLQVGDCNEDETSGYAEIYRESEITWCDSSVDRYDVAYVRADLAVPVAAEPAPKSK